MQQKEKKLEEILRSLGNAVIAFSGGVDSSYLLLKAVETLGEKNVLAVTAISELFGEQEKENARQISRQIGGRHLFLDWEVLAHASFVSNSPRRCYYCKKDLLVRLKKVAEGRGYAWVCEGSNYDDSKIFRPGLKAVQELGIRTPLWEAGLAKEEIRALSRKKGLSTADLPSAACLASRVPYGEAITAEKLKMVSEAEHFLKSLGHEVVRVRHHGQIARIEVKPGQLQDLLGQKDRVINYLKVLGFAYVTVDLEGFRSGSMDEVLGPGGKKC